MLFSAHVYDSNPLKAMTRAAPTTPNAPGLLSARTAVCAPFSEAFFGTPQFGREAMLACWESEADLDKFLEQNPLGADAATGWHMRLELVRAMGVFPGLDQDLNEIAGDKAATMTGPSVAVTCGTAYLTTATQFYKVNKGLERQFINTPEGRWGTAMTNLITRFVATLTVWDSLDAATDYVRTGAHGEAAKNHYDPKKDTTGHTFVTNGGFLGFRPLSMHGEVGGKNAVSSALLESIS